jgi:hypothetical protein
LVISKFLAAALLACAGLFAGLFSTVAAPASADCAPSFTSIPCTIVTNVAQAPATTIGSLSQAPGTLLGQGCAQPTGGNPSGNASNCGLPSITNLAGVGCPPDSSGNSTEPCGLPAAPGQFGSAIQNAPGQLAVGLLSAPGTLAASLAAAPGQFISAIQNGGTAPTG